MGETGGPTMLARNGLLWFLMSGFVPTAGAGADVDNWHANSFYLLHEDHHTSGQQEVGRDADPDETERLIGLSRPDVIQIHAKGNPGWTTYPSAVGFTPSKLARDVLGLWRDIARRQACRFSAYFNIGRDGEIMKRHPEWNRIKANGEPYERALCYHSGVAEAYLWPMVEEVMDEYQPDGFWFDGSCFTVSVCYCAKCRERFRRETGLEAPGKPGEPGWPDYKEMQRQIYREFVRQTVARVKAKDPACLVAFNWAYSLIMPEPADEGLDYLTGDRANQVDVLSREAHWYDSQGKPFDLMTTVYVRKGDVLEPKPAGQIEQEMAIIIANGGRYFAWDNPTRESSLVAERLEFLGDVVAPFLRQRQDWCLRSVRVPDVSLLNSAAAHYAASENSPVCFARPDSHIQGAAETLSRAHIDYEMVSDQRLQRQDVRSPLLIVEDPKALSPADAEALRRYVEGGGIALMTGLGFTRAGLADLFGLELINSASDPEGWTATPGAQSVQFRHRVSRVRLSGAETLLWATDDAGCRYPLLTRRRIGKGQALCALFPFLTPDKDCDLPPALRAFILETALPSAARWVTTNAPGTVETVLRRKGQNLILHLVNRAPGKRELFPGKPTSHERITDIPPAPPCHVSVRAQAKPIAVTLEPVGQSLSGWTWENGRLEADIPGFAIHQMAVVRLPK